MPQENMFQAARTRISLTRRASTFYVTSYVLCASIIVDDKRIWNLVCCSENIEKNWCGCLRSRIWLKNH